MSKTKMLLGLAGSVLLAASFAHAAPLMEKNISQEELFIGYDTLMQKCMKPDFKNITMVIVDRAGQVAFQATPDTVSPHNLELSRRKAYTARTFRQSSLAWRDRTKEGSALFGQRELENTVPLGGGYPIMVDNDVAGGVGVSGTPGGQPADDNCAKMVAESIAADMK
jgi:uncharacterized protein GlcG (DUF336 family)